MHINATQKKNKTLCLIRKHNLIVAQGRISDGRVVFCYRFSKGKETIPVECGSYRAIKLLEHAMKVIERVFERRIREKVKIDAMLCSLDL